MHGMGFLFLFFDYANNAFAFSTIFSTVKPNSLNSSSAGADSPNVVIPTIAPFRPTYLYQKSSIPASIATRRVTELGSTLSLYAGDCASKMSVEGIDTTRTFLPSARSLSADSTASCTSEPVAIRMISGSPSQDST